MLLHAIQPTNIASYNEVLKLENLTFDLSSMHTTAKCYKMQVFIFIIPTPQSNITHVYDNTY